MSRLAVCLTHDVDRVYKSYQYITHDVRQRRWHNLSTLLTREKPYWMFEKVMGIEERYGVRSTWFFLDETVRPRLTKPGSWKLAFGRYRFSDPAIRQIIRDLDAGGWEIGLHGSYNSYRDLSLLQREKAELEAILGKSVLGIRQHYLNLDIPQTWQLQKQAGFVYDASFGKKQAIGYREDRYRPFTHSPTGLLILPLALMECYLFSTAKHDLNQIWQSCLELIDLAQQNDALFSILWHPRMFNEIDFPNYATIYEKIIQECQQRDAEFLTCQQVTERHLQQRM